MSNCCLTNQKKKIRSKIMLTPVKLTLVFFFRKYSMHPTLAVVQSSAKFPIFPRATSFTKIVVYSPSISRKNTSTSAPLLIRNLRETKFSVEIFHFIFQTKEKAKNQFKAHCLIYFESIIFIIPKKAFENLRDTKVKNAQHGYCLYCYISKYVFPW